MGWMRLPDALTGGWLGALPHEGHNGGLAIELVATVGAIEIGVRNCGSHRADRARRGIVDRSVRVC